MKRVFSGINLADTTHLKNLLEHAGIGSFIKHAYLGSAVGELPVFDVVARALGVRRRGCVATPRP